MLTPEASAEIERLQELVDQLTEDRDRARADLAAVRNELHDTRLRRDDARTALETMTNSRDMWRSDAEDADADVARVRGYAEQLVKSDDPAYADHGRALLSVLDGGEG